MEQHLSHISSLLQPVLLPPSALPRFQNSVVAAALGCAVFLLLRFIAVRCCRSPLAAFMRWRGDGYEHSTAALFDELWEGSGALFFQVHVGGGTEDEGGRD